MPGMPITPAGSRSTLLRRAVAAALLALAAAAPIACGPPEPAAPRPDLLLVIVRGQGTALGCYGDAEVHTPRLDAVAARGASMERAYVAAAGTEASLASLLGGRVGADVAAAGAAWSERFRSAGYRTGIVGVMERGALGRRPRLRGDSARRARSGTCARWTASWAAATSGPGASWWCSTASTRTCSARTPRRARRRSAGSAPSRSPTARRGRCSTCSSIAGPPGT